MLRMIQVAVLVALPMFLAAPLVALAQTSAGRDTCDCDLGGLEGVVWWGDRDEMTVAELAAYVAPVIWFSPDEPSLYHASGPNITAPEPFPFQDLAGPVVYYQLKKVVRDANTDLPGYVARGEDKGAAVLDFKSASLLLLEYYAYFAEEWGLGAHQHDVEPVEFRIGIVSSRGDLLEDTVYAECDRTHYAIVVTRVTGKAHGIEWYWNIVEVDEFTRFPMTVLVEEGKHALATDKNGDGYFTRSYDANVRVNDAWGVRDIIRSGGLFAGGYESWMAKVRRPGYRVMPPLPADSPLWEELSYRQGEYRGGNATYKLRPLPPLEEAVAWDAQQGPGSDLASYLDGKYEPDSPEIDEISTIEEALSWAQAGNLKRSLSIALYTDGRLGFSWVFPFFIFKNLEFPMTGGYVLHRMYAKGNNLRDFGWMGLYTPSASRWIDVYLAAGAEHHEVGQPGETGMRTDFVLETGLKFRAQVGLSPLRFLRHLTEFWGIRGGVKSYGGFDIDRLSFVVEVGAGSF